MENENKHVNLILAGLKFKGSEIAAACHDETNTSPAIILISFFVLLGTVIAFFEGNGGSSGLAGMGLTGLDAAVAQLGSLIIGSFLSAYIMVFVIRLFKVKPSYKGILRVYGAAIMWLIFKSVIILMLPANLALVGVLFWLAYNFAVLFGLASYAQIKIWQSFLSIVLSFAVVFGVMMIYGEIVQAVFL